MNEKVTSPSVTAVFAVTRLAVGGLLGWMIWQASPARTAEVEPWDSSSLYYSTSLALAGLVSTLLRPKGWYWGPIGVYVGQLAYYWLVYAPTGPVILPGALAIALFGTVQSIVGGLFGAAIGVALVSGISIKLNDDFHNPVRHDSR